MLELLEVDQYIWGILTTLGKSERQSGQICCTKEITISPNCRWSPVPVELDVEEGHRAKRQKTRANPPDPITLFPASLSLPSRASANAIKTSNPYTSTFERSNSSRNISNGGLTNTSMDQQKCYGSKKQAIVEGLRNRIDAFRARHDYLTKSIKHRRILDELEKETVIEFGPPLRYFSTDQKYSLGKGCNGTSVYVGVFEDGGEVAVKRMLIQACQKEAENEKNILSLIDTKKSPFIVSYRKYLKDRTFIYLILDLCEEPLDKHVESQDNERLQTRGRRMIREILSGLEFLHDKGILHRDLKPSNVLVDVNGHMKLADFGISRVLHKNETTVRTDAKGTEGWMAAEVIKSRKENVKGRFKKKSDIQSAGMIAFFILTKGEHPYGSASHVRMTNIENGNPVNINNLKDSDSRQFVSRLIAKEIKDRPYAHVALLLPFMVIV